MVNAILKALMALSGAGLYLHLSLPLSSAHAAENDIAGSMITIKRGKSLMEFSISEATKQNTLGMSEGFPLGVPHSWNWYKGWNDDGLKIPPAGFTAVTGWGQIYQEEGQPAGANENAKVEVANAKTYVHLTSGEWVLVQDSATNPVVGGHFVTDFSGNAGYTMTPLAGTDGSVAFKAPPDGYNNHFWPDARGTYAAGTVDAVYVQMDMRVTDPSENLVASVGADWWRDANAPYLDDHSTNPGIGSSNWVELSTEWRTLAYYSSPQLLQSDPPPPLVGLGSGGEPTIPTLPVDPTTPTNPTDPTTPTDPTDPTSPPTSPPANNGANLLQNGSFEATTVPEGQWSGSGSLPGWTALSGSTIELWNNTNGVQATDGSNFGELDYLSGDDGFYQDVKTVAGQSYDLSFDSRSRPGFTASTTTVEVLWNDSLIASVPPGSDWKTYNFKVTGTGEQDRLTFREAQGQGSDGLGALYDNVSLIASGTPTSPPVIEPPVTEPPVTQPPVTEPPVTQPPAQNGANLLVNGSFEATPVASNRWADFDSIAGWTAISGGTIELWNNLNGVQATDGSNFGELDYRDATDGLYQTVKTDAGQKYDLSFDARSRPGFDEATSTIEVLWNDKVVARVPPDADWSNYKFTVTGTGEQDRLTFREAEGQGQDGLGALYDNVSLVAQSSTSSASLAASSEMNRAMDLVNQYSAATSTNPGAAETSLFNQNKQESLAPTLAQSNH